MQTLNQIITRRLIVCIIGVAFALILSTVAFYYFHTTAPLAPLLVGLIGAVPMGIIIDDLRQSLKVKKSQQSHYPPERS
jgi:uncharacterized integral membrane protein